MIGTNHMHDAKAAYPPDEPNDIFSGIQAIVNEVGAAAPGIKGHNLLGFSKKAGHGQRTGESGQCHAAPTCGWKTHRASGSQPLVLVRKKLNQALYKSDLLHLNDRGYRAWATALQPLLERHGLPVNPKGFSGVTRVSGFRLPSQPNEGTFLFDRLLGHSAKSGSDHGNGLVALPLSFSPLPKGLDRLGHRLSYRSAFGLDLLGLCRFLRSPLRNC